YNPLVNLIVACVELSQAGGFSDYQRKDTGGHRVEGSQMPDLLGGGDAANFGHHIVGGPPFRFVDYNDAVQGSNQSGGGPDETTIMLASSARRSCRGEIGPVL